MITYRVTYKNRYNGVSVQRDFDYREDAIACFHRVDALRYEDVKLRRKFWIFWI